jgi:serine/threonine protein kinase
MKHISHVTNVSMIDSLIYGWLRCAPSAMTINQASVWFDPPTVPHEHWDTHSLIPYEHIEFLGCGGYASVDAVRRSGKVYARKVFRMRGNELDGVASKLRSEAIIAGRLSHKHIVEIVGTYRWKREFGIIMLPVVEEDLEHYLDRVDAIPTSHLSLERAQLLSWMQCLINGVLYLHEQRICHRDLKPANILVHGSTVVITDFGLAKDRRNDPTTRSTSPRRGRSPIYCAPEVADFEPERKSRPSDIFSLGCVLLEMFTVWADSKSRSKFTTFRTNGTTGSGAYSDNPDKIVQWIFSFVAEHALKIPTTRVLALIAALLDPNATDRPTGAELSAMIGPDTPCCCDSWPFDTCFAAWPSFKNRCSVPTIFPRRWDNSCPWSVGRNTWLERPYISNRTMMKADPSFVPSFLMSQRAPPFSVVFG